MASHQYRNTTVTNSSNTLLGDTHVNNYYAGESDDARYLKVAKGAVFDDRENEKGPLCHPQTRKRLLAEIAQWADDPEGKCIFWLRGAAGTGKSTISRTVAKSFSDKGKLAASFFFNRTIDDCRKADLFVTTIANQLIRNVNRAQNIHGLEQLMRKVIDNNPDLPSKGLKMQFDKLILRPLKELRPVGSSTTTLLLAIDALDECDNEDYTGAGPYLERTRMIVGLLGELGGVIGIRVRVFITSRPELPIQLGFKHDVPQGFYQDVVLHEMPPSEIEHDIRAYLEDELKRMQSLYNISPPWPDSDSTTLLVHKCSPLFIYAATICRFMDNRRFHPNAQLKKILESRYRSTNRMEMTYGTVLDQLVFGLDECDHEDVIVRFRKIVGGIILLADPLPVISLSRLLNDAEDDVFHYLRNLQSVLSVPEDQKSDQPVEVFHLSFPEYLLDRSGERSQFFIEEQQTHANLLDCCLRVMTNGNNHSLKNDICHLEDPGVLRKEVEPEKVRENIPRHLTYACMYWVHHLEKARRHTNEMKVYEFLTQFFVHWLEAMSWLGRIEQSVNDIRKLQAIYHSPGSRIALFLEDAGRFVVEHKYAIERAPCQVYVSALLFSPTDSIVKQTFQPEIPKWVVRAPEIATTWNVAQRSLHKYRSDVRAMCYSHDGVYLAIATKKGVDIWNIGSDTHCAAKDDFASDVSCIAFRSADNVAVGLVSGSVLFWDWTNGQQSLQKLSESCVVYMLSSVNGGLVFGIWGGDVYLWKQNVGIIHQWKTRWQSMIRVWSIQLHNGYLYEMGISYSVDGRFVAIIQDRCRDHIDVYDADSGSRMHEICAPKGNVFSRLSILPNNLLLTLSGLCNTRIPSWFPDFDSHVEGNHIQLWDLSCTDMEAPVKEVSFTSRSYVRSALNQSGILCLQTVKDVLDIWNMRETPVLIHTFSSIHQSCFSPDGRYIAAANSGHVTIIDTLHLLSNAENTIGFQFSKDFDVHHSTYKAACSPDGSRLAMISFCGRVIVWDFDNGQVVPSCLDPLKPSPKETHHDLALSWSIDGASLFAAMSDKLIIYSFLSGHGPTKDTYPLGRRADGDSRSTLTPQPYLCCSSRGSYLALITYFSQGKCEIVTWKLEGRSLKHLWTKDVASTSAMDRRSCCLTFSPDEMWLACLVHGQEQYGLMLMNAESGSFSWETNIGQNWYPLVVVFDSTGSSIVVGADNCYENVIRDDLDDDLEDDADVELDDAVLSEDPEGGGERNNERKRSNSALIYSVHDGGRLLCAEPLKRWSAKHAKSFSVGYLGAAPIIVEPQHWLRLEHLAEQDGTHASAKASCHVYDRRVDGDHWLMKGGRRKVLLPGKYGNRMYVDNWNSLPHRFFGYDNSERVPWLIELDCYNCIFPGNFLEMKCGN